MEFTKHRMGFICLYCAVRDSDQLLHPEFNTSCLAFSVQCGFLFIDGSILRLKQGALCLIKHHSGSG
jgi:hypothetical protein